MTMDCQQQFDSIIDVYAGMPLYLPDVTTEQNCSEVIPAALDDTTGANCPVQQVLLGCFLVSPGTAVHVCATRPAIALCSNGTLTSQCWCCQLVFATLPGANTGHARSVDMSSSQYPGPARRLD